MKNVLKKALAGLFALSAIFEVQNSLPPTPDYDMSSEALANSLTPTPETSVRLANSLPPCIENPEKAMANSLPPTPDMPIRIANSLPPVAEYGKMQGRC